MIVQEQSNQEILKATEELLQLRPDSEIRGSSDDMNMSQDSHLRTIYNALVCGVIVYDEGLEVVEANKAVQEILGLDLPQLQMTLKAPNALHFQALDGHILTAEELPSRVVLRTGKPLRNVIVGLTRADGQRRWLQVDAVLLLRGYRESSQVVVSLIDVTERIEAERQARENAQRLQTIINNLPVSLFAFDQNGMITFLEGQGVKGLGMDREHTLAPSVFDLCQSVPVALNVLRRVLAGETFSTMIEVSEYVIEAHFVPMQDQDTGITGAICVAIDATERVQAQAERAQAEDARHYQALHDILTGLPNRTSLQKELEEELASAKSDGGNMALLMMDMDHFKEINDTFGHDLGDLLLQQVGERIRQVAHPLYTVARLGGDEFALLLPHTNTKQAREVAESLEKAFEHPFEIDGFPLHIKCSLGIVICPAHGSDALTLLRRVEVAMYQAKEAHEAYMVYKPEQDQNSFQRMALLGALRKAIAADEIVLYYQPKVDVRTGVIRGVEALARWSHPEYGFVPPAQFIPMAEQTGLIVPLTHKVLELALQQCGKWHREGIDLSISVNLSMWNLREPALPDTIATLLERYGVAPGSLCVEITESAVMADVDCSMRVLQRLFDLGVRIAIDDFGTGYSSLAYLKRLPVDELKVDRSFVQEMVSIRSDASIVRATVNMAHSLGLRVVAEGVEDLDTWNLLESFSCDTIQGYYLARPLPAQEFEQWLMRRNCLPVQLPC